MYEDLIGCKFTVHGRSKEEGFDCYGLAIEVLKRNGITLPDIPYNSLEYRELARADIFQKVTYTILENPCKNCIIEIEEKGLPLHIGIYIGNGKMIHSHCKYGVIIEPLRRYEKRIRSFYKVENNSL